MYPTHGPSREVPRALWPRDRLRAVSLFLPRSWETVHAGRRLWVKGFTTQGLAACPRPRGQGSCPVWGSRGTEPGVLSRETPGEDPGELQPEPAPKAAPLRAHAQEMILRLRPFWVPSHLPTPWEAQMARRTHSCIYSGYRGRWTSEALVTGDTRTRGKTWQ